MAITLKRVGYEILEKTYEYIGLSTDTKPTTDIPNGSSFFEMDTGDTYYFDAETAQDWITPSA